jgi:acyl carrier protein
MKSLRSSVLQVLARHIGRPKSTIHPWLDLEDDLDMSSLDVILVALEVGATEGVEVDVTGLELVHTVAELSTFLTDEVAEGHSPSTAQWSLGAPDSVR